MTKGLIFDQVIDFSFETVKMLDASGVRSPQNQKESVPWVDAMYIGDRYRRAHVHTVDARAQLNLWVMHCTVFPQINDPSPIFGLDIIAGPSRISGAFLDFSRTAEDDHFMMRWFDETVTDLNWKKTRILPEWALNIFSPAMVAVGAVNTQNEIDQLINVFSKSLDYYLTNVGKTINLGHDYTQEQNRYCHYQKQNPHTTRIMRMLGLENREANRYFEEVMFPEMIQ
jgi:phycocyanobilin:ferredoxin oxidoreductase